MQRGKNVPIPNVLQLEASRVMPTPALSRFNYDAMPSLKSLNLSMIHYFTMWLWPLTFWPSPLTFDLEHLQRIACDVIKLPNKFERNRETRHGVIAISVFDLIDLEHCITCCARLWGNFHQVWPSTTYPWLNYSVYFDADKLCHAVTLTFDFVTLNFYSTSCIVRFKHCTKFERNRIIHRQVLDDLARFRRASLRGGARLTNDSQGCVDKLHPTWPEHMAIIPTQEVCFRVRISCCIFKRGRLKVEWCWKRRQISHFLTPSVNIRGGVGEISIPIIEALFTTEPPEHIWCQSTAGLLTAVDW